MSRLDSFIRRLKAQRACLGEAARLVAGLAGPVLELGLGNGRTYDHLRELFPERHIFVCERHLAAHPNCIPPAEFLLLGDMRETLPQMRAQLGGRVALAHLDAGSGEVPASRALARELAPLILPRLERNLRPATKNLFKTGIALYERGRERAAEMGEFASDMMAEARAEYDAEQSVGVAEDNTVAVNEVVRLGNGHAKEAGSPNA